MAELPDEIRYWRDERRTLRSNLPHRHHHHSDDFEVGFAGSGPAEFALNILAVALPGEPGGATVALHDGSRVSGEAWDRHQEFKRQLVARLPRGGGIIPAADLAAWLERERAASDGAAADEPF